MRPYTVLLATIALPASLSAQTRTPTDSVPSAIVAYERFADVFGSRLVAAFDSIPASRYDYRPTPQQQSVGYIAQHLEDANYGLCESFGTSRHPLTSKDSLADTVKARWPKDTLVARLRASLDFCADAMDRLEVPKSAVLTSTLLAFETDLAEHYSQLATYMRLLGMVPPSSLPRRTRTAIVLPASTLSQYVGVYQLGHGRELDVTRQGDTLYIGANTGGSAVKLLAENANDFFVNEVDAQVTFTRSASGDVTGFVLHQFGRDRFGRKR